jgi:hypothetical protein
LSASPWRPLPWVENDNSATLGSSSSKLRALCAVAIAMSASSAALGCTLTAQSAKISAR